jgi:hypothetical protein
VWGWGGVQWHIMDLDHVQGPDSISCSKVKTVKTVKIRKNKAFTFFNLVKKIGCNYYCLSFTSPKLSYLIFITKLSYRAGDIAQ